ncbi:hypothetical protein GCM10009609_48580 [Pseudonocardia aurantiaca]
MYCAAVLDAYSRPSVGWSIDDNMRIALVVDALGMAISRRRPEPHSAVLHSDHGSQYTSWAFGQRILEAGLGTSMGSVGECYDNSMTESFWGTRQLDARLKDMEDPRPACQRDIRVGRMPVQPTQTPFQYRNALAGVLRSSPHRQTKITDPTPSVSGAGGPSSRTVNRFAAVGGR